MNANDIETTLRARAAFNASVDSIDADTRRRLRESRLQAQHGAQRRARWVWPTGAALTAALVLVVLLPRTPHVPVATVPTTMTTIAQPAVATTTTRTRGDIASIADITAPDPVNVDAIEAADPDMLSDIEFYGWLAKQPNANASGD
jgi:hypothetical protein